MPMLTVPTFGDVPVDVLSETAAQQTTEEVGERRRAFNGDMHSTIRARKRSWSFRTKLMTRADADSLVSALEGTQPLACSGDALGGAVSCHYEPGTFTDRTMAGTTRYRVVEFTLHEQ